jgi:hypothetical protein
MSRKKIQIATECVPLASQSSQCTANTLLQSMHSVAMYYLLPRGGLSSTFNNEPTTAQHPASSSRLCQQGIRIIP